MRKVERDKRLSVDAVPADMQNGTDAKEEFSIPMTSKGKIFSVPDPYIGRRYYFGIPPQKSEIVSDELEIVFDEGEEDCGLVSGSDSTKGQK